MCPETRAVLLLDGVVVWVLSEFEGNIFGADLLVNVGDNLELVLNQVFVVLVQDAKKGDKEF